MIDQLLALPIEQKIGQLFFVGISGPTLDEATAELLSEITPGGICLFARNIREPFQTRELLDRISEDAAVLPFLSLDQEGGLVDRLRRVLEPMPAANRIGSVAQAARYGDIVAESIRILGFNMNFAPVVDVVTAERSKFPNGLNSRAFGESKEDVVSFAGAFMESMRARDVLNCIKHFPGLGASQIDSHEDLPQVQVSEVELFSNDLYPYRTFINAGTADTVMVAHASFPAVDLQETGQDDKLLPSSLSCRFITDLLRKELGFSGIVLTDDLEMGAIIRNYGIGEACKMAILAGNDMLSICADPTRIREGFAAVRNAFAVGEISEVRINDSLQRIAALKSRIKDPLPFDNSRLQSLSAAITDFKDQLAHN